MNCSQCDKYFRSRFRLNAHKKTHVHDKPFFCDHCGKPFKKSENLKVHIRIHTEEKPYSCQQCTKIFNYPSNLKNTLLFIGRRKHLPAINVVNLLKMQQT